MSVMMKLDDKWSLSFSSSLGIDLCRHTTSTDKTTGKTKDVWLPRKYYSSLESALKGYVEMSVRDSENYPEQTVELKDMLHQARLACERLNAIYEEVATAYGESRQAQS